jgi:hypothetical protein
MAANLQHARAKALRSAGTIVDKKECWCTFLLVKRNPYFAVSDAGRRDSERECAYAEIAKVSVFGAQAVEIIATESRLTSTFVGYFGQNGPVFAIGSRQRRLRG